MTKKVPKSAAILTIKDAPNMSEKGKKEVAEWLKRQAKMLIKEGDNYAKNFTARYLY
jgi:hypothetical protein